MAQAARLSLRMQKELKLLLSDPPPGACLPLLSTDSDLSSIDADIEGPEGTVYAKGVFRVKIQIPERYPFQPPNVTFATPIYHPNIDTGGRICLDILNLPPKGSWQPSLNISTVLMSIRLLLSEPNPDDGLMCEASREYKYNRQAFDQKALSMTQKYARAGARGSTCSESSVQLNPIPSTMMEGAEESDKAQDGNKEMKSDQKKFWGISRKLSLVASSSVSKGDGNIDAAKMPNPCSSSSGCERNLSSEGTKGGEIDDKNTDKYGKLDLTKQELSLESHHAVGITSNQKGNKNDASDSGREKAGSGARVRKLSLGQRGPLKKLEMDNKENIFPVKKLQLSGSVNASAGCAIGEEFSLSPLSDLQEINSSRNYVSHSTKGSRDLLKSKEVDPHGAEATAPTSEMVIVLDSEDEETECPRKEGLLGRKRLKNRYYKV